MTIPADRLPSLTARHPELVSGSIFPRARSKRGEAQSYRKVRPVRVGCLDNVQLPRAVPVLELLLAGNGGVHRGVHFVPDEALDRVAFGEAGKRRFAMLPQAGHEVGGHADVERSARLACKDVDAGIALSRHDLRLEAKWTLKQVQGDDTGGGGRYDHPRRPPPPASNPEIDRPKA